MLVDSVAALHRLGYPCDACQLFPYARHAAELADHDAKLLQQLSAQAPRAGAAVTLTVLVEPLLVAMRRLAIVEACHRRTAVEKTGAGCVQSAKQQREMLEKLRVDETLRSH
ncbi:hypothetical protein [Streptomyces sp. 2323.1]|uniref:hypothetical protein n=1 Tax=Streptomyces sp. 2323.1 TaxID=1938841 RepID=UPI002690C24C